MSYGRLVPSVRRRRGVLPFARRQGGRGWGLPFGYPSLVSASPPWGCGGAEAPSRTPPCRRSTGVRPSVVAPPPPAALRHPPPADPAAAPALPRRQRAWGSPLPATASHRATPVPDAPAAHAADRPRSPRPTRAVCEHAQPSDRRPTRAFCERAPAAPADAGILRAHPRRPQRTRAFCEPAPPPDRRPTRAFCEHAPSAARRPSRPTRKFCELRTHVSWLLCAARQNPCATHLVTTQSATRTAIQTTTQFTTQRNALAIGLLSLSTIQVTTQTTTQVTTQTAAHIYKKKNKKKYISGGCTPHTHAHTRTHTRVRGRFRSADAPLRGYLQPLAPLDAIPRQAGGARCIGAKWWRVRKKWLKVWWSQNKCVPLPPPTSHGRHENNDLRSIH